MNRLCNKNMFGIIFLVFIMFGCTKESKDLERKNPKQVTKTYLIGKQYFYEKTNKMGHLICIVSVQVSSMDGRQHQGKNEYVYLSSKDITVNKSVKKNNNIIIANNEIVVFIPVKPK